MGQVGVSLKLVAPQLFRKVALKIKLKRAYARVLL